MPIKYPLNAVNSYLLNSFVKHIQIPCSEQSIKNKVSWSQWTILESSKISKKGEISDSLVFLSSKQISYSPQNKQIHMITIIILYISYFRMKQWIIFCRLGFLSLIDSLYVCVSSSCYDKGVALFFMRIKWAFLFRDILVGNSNPFHIPHKPGHQLFLQFRIYYKWHALFPHQPNKEFLHLSNISHFKYQACIHLCKSLFHDIELRFSI